MPVANPWLSGSAPTQRLPRARLEERILNLLSSQNMCALAPTGPDGRAPVLARSLAGAARHRRALRTLDVRSTAQRAEATGQADFRPLRMVTIATADAIAATM